MAVDSGFLARLLEIHIDIQEMELDTEVGVIFIYVLIEATKSNTKFIKKITKNYKGYLLLFNNP